MEKIPSASWEEKAKSLFGDYYAKIEKDLVLLEKKSGSNEVQNWLDNLERDLREAPESADKQKLVIERAKDISSFVLGLEKEE